jgi:hypothetical protein
VLRIAWLRRTALDEPFVRLDARPTWKKARLPLSKDGDHRRISGRSSNPLDFNPQWMFLNLGHQQDLALLLFRDLKRIGARNALTSRMDGQGQGQSI